MPNKRISVVGRGLGAYFPAEDPTAPQTQAVAQTEAQPDRKRQVRPKPAGSPLPDSSRPQDVSRITVGGTVLENAATRVARQAYINAAFRFSKDELVALSDLVHDINKKRDTRLTKQDVVRLALANLLADHELNGDKSLLVQFLNSGRRIGGSS